MNFLKNSILELQKVVWPKQKSVFSSLIKLIIVIFVLVLFIAFVDLILTSVKTMYYSFTSTGTITPPTWWTNFTTKWNEITPWEGNIYTWWNQLWTNVSTTWNDLTPWEGNINTWWNQLWTNINTGWNQLWTNISTMWMNLWS